MRSQPYHGATATELVPNEDQIRSLFGFWFHHAIRGLIEIGWINPRSGKLTQFERFELGDDDRLVQRVCEVNRVPGQSVYFRVTLLNPDITSEYTTDEDFLSSPGVWGDLDDDKAVKGAPNIYSSIRPGAYVITGKHPHTRAQPFWRCDELITDPAVLRRLVGNIARVLSGDKTVTNPTRLMRVGGTIAWPYKAGRVIEMTRFKSDFGDNRPQDQSLATLLRGFPNELTALDRLKQDIVNAPISPPAMIQNVSTANVIAMSDMTATEIDPRSTLTGHISPAKALANMRRGQHWHNNMIALVAHWVWRDWTDSEILNQASGVTLPGYTELQTMRDMDKAIRGARKKYNHPEPQHDRITTAPTTAQRAWEMIWARDIEPNVSTLDFVEDVLRDGEMSVVYGESGCGKTFIVLDIAFHVAIGKPWRGHAVDQGGVIYCALEGGHGIKNRIAALKRHHRMHDVDIPLAVIPSSVNLLDPEADTNKLIASIKEAAEKCGHPIKLVVVDTLSRALAGGNENAPDDMGALVINADRIRQVTGAHVLFVHHSGKNQALGARGHSLLRAATDTEIEVARVLNTTALAKRSTVNVTKQRELEYAEEFTFTLKSIELGMNRRGKPVTSCVIEAVDPNDDMFAFREPGHLAPKQQDVFKAIKNLYATPNVAFTEIPRIGMSPQRCIKRSDLVDELIAVSFVLRQVDDTGNLSLPNKESVKINDNLNLLGNKGLIGFNTRLVWRIPL